MCVCVCVCVCVCACVCCHTQKQTVFMAHSVSAHRFIFVEQSTTGKSRYRKAITITIS